MQPSPQQMPGLGGLAQPPVLTMQQGLIIAPMQSNGTATAGMVLGIISLTLSILSPIAMLLCCFVSIPMAALGVIISHVGYSNSKKTGVGNGQAVAGLVLNWIQVLPAVILFALGLLEIYL